MFLNGDIVRLVRTALKMTVEQLAEQARISTSLLSAIERGERKLTPTVESRLRLAIQLNDEELKQLAEIQRRIRGERP